MMSRKPKAHPAQLVLALERPAADPPIACGSRPLMEALAELLLQALGGREEDRNPRPQGGADERQDHA